MATQKFHGSKKGRKVIDGLFAGRSIHGGRVVGGSVALFVCRFEAGSAAATARRVGVFHLEPGIVQRVFVIDLGAVEKFQALGIDSTADHAIPGKTIPIGDPTKAPIEEMLA